LTVFENLQAAFLVHHGRGRNFWTRADSLYRDETNALLASVGLSGQERTIAGTLSYGNQKQLELGLALAGAPAVLLLDEPSEGLAPLVVEALLHNIRALKKQGVTILLAEQGVDFSLALADRVYILEKGAIRYTGAAAELRDDQELRDRLLSL
jgi:ABC-type branched-subunit amino acid transport system ATPase component